jgi:DNA-binding transcriptional regulator YdaS (Cro superfamily)
MVPMDLKTFLKTLPDEAALEAFAVACETSPGHLRNVMYGTRPCSPELAVLIESNSKGAVTRQDLRKDWRRIWPELDKSRRVPARV